MQVWGRATRPSAEQSDRRFPLGIVLAAVPRFMESHVVSRLHFNPPTIVPRFGGTRHQAKRRARPLNRKRLHHDAAIIEWTQLRHSLFQKLAGPSPVQDRTRTEIVDSCFNELPVRVEDINCEELPATLIAQSRNERRGDENLQTILRAANTAGVVLIVVDGN
jgi:hypothetical protein